MAEQKSYIKVTLNYNNTYYNLHECSLSENMLTNNYTIDANI